MMHYCSAKLAMYEKINKVIGWPDGRLFSRR
jgi:hypothetical protein